MTGRDASRTLVCLFAITAATAGEVDVGFGKADVTPDLASRTAWIAGYGNNRKATGVHDPLFARAVVVRDRESAAKVALVSIDLVGVQLPSVRRIRTQLPGYAHVLVSSTHNHEGPDVIGLWGPSPRESGVDPEYIATMEAKVVAAVKEAEAALRPAKTAYGTADSPDAMLRDARLPAVKDPTLRAIRFTAPDDGKTLGLLVQWNCHPESLGSKNTLITADFPYATVAALEAKHGCPVAYFTGAVGGLMTNPPEFTTADGAVLKDETFAYAEAFGRAVADVADRAIATAQPLELAPIVASAGPVWIPLANPGYRQGRAIGVLPREAFAWTGDPDRPGPPLPDRQIDGEIALETEVAYLRLGDLHIAGIPGELYPELVYGQYQEPVEPNADFPDAPLEPPVMTTLPGPKTLLFGLANDEVGYILPKRQWDEKTPFAYGRKDKQYGEVNSVGPEVGPILMKALKERVARASSR